MGDLGLRSVRLGARGSALSMAQARYARALCQAAASETPIEIVVIQSLGDAIPDKPLADLGAQGIFTRELERALTRGEIDLAVHSAKDLPSELDPAFHLAAIPRREDPRDSLLTQRGWSLTELPRGATIGTGSPRRVAQLARLRPDLRFVPLRGNVDTRRRKVLEGMVDGAILAIAGLARLGLVDDHVVALPIDLCLPQAGQGALALEISTGDRRLAAMLEAVDDNAANAAVTAERAVLGGLEAGCHAAVAAHAVYQGSDLLVVRGLVLAVDGSTCLEAERSGPPGEGRRLGAEVAMELRRLGAVALLQHETGHARDAARETV